MHRRPPTRREADEGKGKEEELKTEGEDTPPPPPPKATPKDAGKDALRSLWFLAKTLGGWARFGLAYFRLDWALYLVAGGVLLPWLARHVLGAVLGRVVLPYAFGKGYEESKHAYHEWVSAAIDRLIPPPGVDEGRAGEGIINSISGADKNEKGLFWWRPQVGVLLIKGVRWGVKKALGV